MKGMSRRKKKKVIKKAQVEVVKGSVKKHIPEIVKSQVPSKAISPKLPALGDGLTHYLETIQHYPLLSKEEEFKIAQRYRETKDPKDAEILVTSNLRFVVKVAAEYSQFKSKLIDLIQEGNMGLMHAVKEFNPYKGARLITYAVWWIKGYIQDYLMKQYSLVKIGTTHSQRKLFYNLKKEKSKLDRMGMEPTVKLLSSKLGVSEKDVRMMEQRMTTKDLSLDQSVTDNNSLHFLDLQQSSSGDITEELIKKESFEQLHQAIDNLRPLLSEKEIYLLEKRLLNDEPMKLQEIGNKWKVSREAVRQMEARLLKKIKQEML